MPAVSRGRPNSTFIVAGLALMLAGCGTTDSSVCPPEVYPPGSLADIPGLIRLTTIPGALFPSHLDPGITRLFTLAVDGRAGASAIIWNAGSEIPVPVNYVRISPVSPGAAKLALNWAAFCIKGDIAEVYTTFTGHPAGIGLAFDGVTIHRFEVGGNSIYPTLDDEVLSVSAPVLSAPPDGAAVARASDLSVSWSNAGTDTTVYAVAGVTSLVDTTRVALGALVRDADGAATVPAQALGLLPAGAARLTLARIRGASHVRSGRSLVIYCESAVTRGLALTP